MKSLLVLWLLLGQTEPQVIEGGGEVMESWPGPDEEGLHYGVSLEVSGLALLPRLEARAVEGYAQVEPTLILDGGETWGLNVGTPVRLAVARGASSPEAGGGLLRGRDWDSLSDYGQWLRALKVGARASPLQLNAGALDEYSLMGGHLVGRYSNRFNPDYLPAGATVAASLEPVYAEAFTSDVLAARLVGAELAFNLAWLEDGSPDPDSWAALSLSAARDFGRAEGRTPEVTLAHADLDLGVVLRDDYQVYVMAAAGTRAGMEGAWGALLGARLVSISVTLHLHAQLEARRQRGGFRQGFFGPDYELGRFVAAGPSALPAAQSPFPDGYSVFGELTLGRDTLHLDHARRELHVSVAAEAFSWGRLDAHVRVSTWRMLRHLYLALDALMMGVGQPGARYTVSGEVRYRFSRRLYVLGRAGTLLFPQPDSTVRPGAQALLGVGADYAR